MLDDAGARPPVERTPNQRRNPLVPLPIPAEEVVRGVDAVFVTHLHRDHFDDAAARLVPRDVAVFCQPADAERLRAHGLDARAVEDAVEWRGLSIARTGGRHGTGDLGAALGPVSGFVLDGLYVAGDTIWCEEVEAAIEPPLPRAAGAN